MSNCKSKPGLDEVSIVQSAWTSRESTLRDRMLTGEWSKYLQPASIAELERCRKFEPGMKVREITVRFVHDLSKTIRLFRKADRDERMCASCGTHRPSKGQSVCCQCR